MKVKIRKPKCRFKKENNFDESVKSPFGPIFVIPAKAGIHPAEGGTRNPLKRMDSRFHGNDRKKITDFLRFHHL
jgi:hypothetical protein